MKRRLLKLTALFGFLLTMSYAHADIISASVTPTQRQLVATGVNTFSANWQVNTDSAHRAGTTSSIATLINSANGATLGTLGTALSDVGSGPFSFNETISISPFQVSNWQSSGISLVVLQRVFNDPGSNSTVIASIRLLIPTPGELSVARVSPSQSQLVANKNNEFSASWYIAAGSGHTNGVVSTGARLVNPRNGATLATLGNTLSASGSGPFAFSENIVLDTTLTQNLINQRLNRVVLLRTFMDPVGGGAVEASMLLLLSRSQLTTPREAVTGSLSVQGMRLEFATGNNLALVDMKDSLQAKLILAHSGNGLLQGRWQIAEPGSSESIPLYRTLALVRRNISSAQRTVLHSPELPTSRTGKYLLRFCVTNRNMVSEEQAISEQCPIENLVINAAYQVQGEVTIDMTNIKVLSPNQQKVDASTPFSWQPVVGAKVYQLQVFALVPAKGRLPSSQDSEVTIEPKFIVGMVLPAETTRTPLTELVCSKLQPNKRYLWRITAHEETGRLVGSSTDASFVFAPQEQTP
jgi:hypothetical protein